MLMRQTELAEIMNWARGEGIEMSGNRIELRFPVLIILTCVVDS